ncbi:MAG: hypothetical protein JNG82_05105 [Opitutaceae bacterium]|nr:hypothetical protein [Opitutaceae bacterium]
MTIESDRSGERQRHESVAPKGQLPRLAPEAYRGHAFVHWTLTLETRATGWLSPAFHHTWRNILLHACARYHLICPCYTLMPDHMHLLWAGTASASDQRLAIGFLRRHLVPALAPASWQKQPHDHVLRESEREQGAFAIIAHYILENPVRAGLVARWQDYEYIGCCVAGYPEFTPHQDDHWLRFWRVYNHLVQAAAQ